MYYVSEVTGNSLYCQKFTLELHLVMVTPNSSKLVHNYFKTEFNFGFQFNYLNYKYPG